MASSSRVLESQISASPTTALKPMVELSKPVSQDPTVSTKVEERDCESQTKGAISIVSKSSAVVAAELLPVEKAVSEVSAARIPAKKKVHNRQAKRELPIDGSEGSAVMRTTPSVDQPRSTKAGNSEASTKKTQNSRRGKESTTMPRTRRHATPERNEREMFPKKEKTELKRAPSKKISSRLSRSISDRSDSASPKAAAGSRSREEDRRKPERGGRRRIGDVEASGRARTRSRRKHAAD
jgi:hypothetical protein